MTLTVRRGKAVSQIPCALSGAEELEGSDSTGLKGQMAMQSVPWSPSASSHTPSFLSGKAALLFAQIPPRQVRAEHGAEASLTLFTEMWPRCEHQAARKSQDSNLTHCAAPCAPRPGPVRETRAFAPGSQGCAVDPTPAHVKSLDGAGRGGGGRGPARVLRLGRDEHCPRLTGPLSDSRAH